jgi:serine/threonine protein kinase
MKTCPQCDTGYPDSQIACPIHGHLLNEIRELKPGMVIHKTYRIVRKLGQGGMGTVYLAQHILMDEPRALKFLSPELSSDLAFTSRFLREVRTLRQIRNRNVVDCGDLEAAEDDSLFFSMEFVDGPDLRTFLHDASQYTDCHPERTLNEEKGESKDLHLPLGALPVLLALSITRQIAEGLGAAHLKGMVHRDIKPENILMARDVGAWLPKIADFGIVATKESSTAYTRTGGTLLTMAYAAPEQWRGTPAAELDGRTDLYALGGLLYEMLTGQTPFHAENYEGWARQHQTTPPPPPSALRPDLANWQGLDALTLRLLAKDRKKRPNDVAEVLGLLDAVRLIPSVAHRETEIGGPAARLGQKIVGERLKLIGRRGIFFGLLAGGFILAALAVWFISQRSKQPANAEVQAPSVVQPQSATSQPAQPQPTQLANSKPTSPQPSNPQGPKPNQVEIPKPSVQQPSIAEIEKRATALNNQDHYAEAAPLYDQACKAGSSNACGSLAFMYHEGHGVAQNSIHAVELYSKACDAGDPKACTNLGTLYSEGNGIPQDYPRAVTLYTKGCDANIAKACYFLGESFYLGLGVKQNNAQAATLFSKACDGEIADGCFFLGISYRNGDGVDKDQDKARELLKKACSIGSQEGCDQLKKMQ